MSESILTINLALGMSLATALALVVYMVKASMEYGAMRLQVNTMWQFQMRRAMSEVVASGIGEINSPVIFTKLAVDSLDPIKPDLLTLWNETPKPISDLAMLLRIEEKFGDQLLSMVCIPCRLSHGACLILALTIAKGDNAIDLAFDTRNKGRM
jgi:hypothetical protein